MRTFPRILIGIAILALAGCVYPGYSYVRGGYQGGYYTGNAYYYDDYAPAYYYGGYGCCGYGYGYGPSVSIGLGYYGGGYRHHGYSSYRGHGRTGYPRPDGGSHGSWHGGNSHGGRRGGGSHDRHHH
jgi:hypothetical protein